MIVVLALSNSFSLPITATYMSGPPGTTFSPPVVLFKTPVGLTVAIFLGLSALAHFIVASPKFFPRYSDGLAVQRNYFRWVEYSISCFGGPIWRQCFDDFVWLAAGEI